MIYLKIDTHENNKLKTCPICQNEETVIDGNYCQICGTYLYNECSNCDCENPLPTNARFCTLCRSESIFYRNGILKAWNDYEPKGFMDIPEGVENEGLPFN